MFGCEEADTSHVGRGKASGSVNGAIPYLILVTLVPEKIGDLIYFQGLAVAPSHQA